VIPVQGAARQADARPATGPAATGPASTGPASTDLTARPDGELLDLVHHLPARSGRRAAACEALVLRYKSMVRACANRYAGSPEPEEELMQSGYVGLLKAINNFDPAYGGNLAAYAQPCISGEIKRHFRDQRWQVRVKRPVQELLLEVRKARTALEQDLGQVPSDADVAGHLGVTVQAVREADRAELIFHPQSLDAPVSVDSEAATFGDLLGEDDPQVEHTVDMQAVATHWNDLPERERRILALRFYGNMTQAEIGQKLGLSQMHVSRLLARALGYLRECLLGPEAGSAAREAG
jgi:RNA polymerase sigma-B factor